MSQQARERSFDQVREGRTQILLEPGFHQWLKEMGIHQVGTIIEKAQIDPHRGGRQDCRIYSLEGREGDCLVIRRYAHGGLLRRLLGDRFFLGSRPFREMRITEEIRGRGIPTAQVAAALRHRGWGPFYHGELITKEIPAAKDLISFVLDLGKPCSKEERALRRETARQIGRSVRFMHDQGIYHGDLNLRNLLIQTAPNGDQKVYIIDFDRSRIRDSLSIRYRLKNLLRLNRSTEKWKAKGVCISYTDKARFFQAYAEGDRDIARAMKHHLKKARIYARWYRLGWRVDRLLNPSNH